MTTQGKILVVDAARHIVRLTETNLERAGYRVIAASDGEEALAKAESEKPDMIVLGTIPPPVDAAELLECLRANEATKGVRVVTTTAKVSDLDLSDDRG
jgi:two-component system alkaline phosphatase synthesis response regulator PhoP